MQRDLALKHRKRATRSNTWALGGAVEKFRRTLSNLKFGQALFIKGPRVYFRTFLACLTKFSITPSNVSRSPIFSSVRFCQYSSTSLAVASNSSSFFTCALSSSSVMPSSASSVVVHVCLAAIISSSGCGGGPFLRLGFPCVSTDVDELLPSPCRSRETERDSLEFRGDAEAGTLSEGSTSFFCFEAGRISSRSTGTPRETRKRRRVRDRIQSGGANGGGATSCDQREAERGVLNDVFSLGRGGNCGTSSSSGGKRLVR